MFVLLNARFGFLTFKLKGAIVICAACNKQIEFEDDCCQSCCSLDSLCPDCKILLGEDSYCDYLDCVEFRENED